MFIGVDLVEIKRMADQASNTAFLQRVYTAEELELIENVSEQRKHEILAGRFAVKEAVSKALGTGIADGVTFKDIQTVKGLKNEPVVTLSGKALQLAEKQGVCNIRVSLSHAGGLAIAYVLLEV